MSSDNAANSGYTKDPGRLADLSRHIAEGTLSPVDLVQQCLDRIAAAEASVEAWRQLDAERALEIAEQRASEARSGNIRGPLHGIPFGVKDIIDVEGLPTRCNSRSRENAPPATADAEIILQLKTQGAIVLGKTHTTEFAYFDPSPARNPWNTEHTPGGSSSGSAAAVAAGMVPLALGTQTTASLNRPAAYCGIAGFKPSTRSVPGYGVAPLASSYDTVGFYGGRVADAVFAFKAVRAPYLAETSGDTQSVEVVLLDDALIKDAEPDATNVWQAMADRLKSAGIRVTRTNAPMSFEGIRQLHWQTQIFEMGRTHRDFLEMEPGEIGNRLLETLREGLKVTEKDYLDMRGKLDSMRRDFFANFRPNQFFLWPATPGPAPRGISSTGDPRYIAPWTGLGGPIVTIPAGLAGNGLPLGCIVCARPGQDVQLADVAVQLAEVCEDSPL